VDGAVFDGFRVLEVGTWVMVPAAATVLADFGAEVIKVEHPHRGDPARGLVTGGVSPRLGAVNIMMEQINRGKRSVGLDIAVPEGREILCQLAASSDVFMTSFLPDTRQRLGLSVEQIRECNPQIVYVRADAVGSLGPEAGKPGYDSAVFFGRGGILDSLSGRNAELAPPRLGFGDKTASMNIAFGVAAALLKRERTGVTSIVDVSLLSAAMWVASSDITYSGALGADFTRQERRATNPIANFYRTSDGRWIALAMLESDRWWPELCRHLGREDLQEDGRFVDATARAQNAEACVLELAAVFAGQPIEEWRRRFATLRAPWEVVQNQMELLDDPQAVANGYITEVAHWTGEKYRLIRPPVQFDETPPELGFAPEPGEHTEEVLLELGYNWEDIARLKNVGAIS
jgi:crotonobetainyl-CoA:carnitine CoA-transferase CaiB-like acyl-CoA transferase